MSTKQESQASARDRRQNRLYRREFGIAMGLYLGLWAILTFWTAGEKGADVWWMLLFLPLLVIAAAGVRNFQRADEYQRERQLQAMGVAFVMSMLAALFMGLLGAAGIATAWSGWVIYSVGMLAWAVAAWVQAARDA